MIVAIKALSCVAGYQLAKALFTFSKEHGPSNNTSEGHVDVILQSSTTCISLQLQISQIKSVGFDSFL